MKTISLYLLPLFLLLLTACPGDTKEDDPAPTASCLLQRQDGTTGTTKNSDGFTYSYTYNTKQQLTSVALDSVFESGRKTIYTNTLAYDAKNRLTKVTGLQHLTYEYNPENQLVKQARYYDREHSFYTFSSNIKNELVEVKYYYTGEGIAEHRYTWKYTNTNGNPTHIGQYNKDDELIAEAELTYDVNPKSANVLFAEFEPMAAFPSKNNVTGFKLRSSFGITESYAVTYTYNEKGYPITATRTYSSGYTETIASTYTCR